jgi:hypothetical protein
MLQENRKKKSIVAPSFLQGIALEIQMLMYVHVFIVAVDSARISFAHLNPSAKEHLISCQQEKPVIHNYLVN